MCDNECAGLFVLPGALGDEPMAALAGGRLWSPPALAGPLHSSGPAHTLFYFITKFPALNPRVSLVAGFATERPGTPKAPMEMSSVVLRRPRFSSASVSPRTDGGKDRATLHFKKSRNESLDDLRVKLSS